jgi:two-component system, OmpR family, osmolarity sensor histidine kinase EnvZ
MLMAVAYYVDRREAADGATFAPLLGQIAALTQVLDRVPVADYPLVLRAATGTGFFPRIRPDLPNDVGSGPLRRLAERRLRNLLGDSGDRFVALYFRTGEMRGSRSIVRLRDVIGARAHAVIGLKSGGYLDVEAVGDLTMRLYGVPAGLFAGILGFVFALIALIAVRRETQPLSDLAAAVERIGPDFDLQPVAERGAPELRALVHAVNAMQARIVELIRSRTMVLGAISHDLRTYLTRLRLRLELLPESPQRTKASLDLDGMQALVDDALAFARSSFGNDKDAASDLSSIVKNEHDSREANGDAVSLIGADRPLMVRGSPAALARIVTNLVGNALAYGKCADLSLLALDEAVELRVEDRGPGIPAGDRASVFEPFYRLEPSRNRDHGGAGLGLTIVRQIVESYRGTITIGDRPDGGARVQVRLRRIETRIAATTSPQRPADAHTASTPTSS